MRTRMRNGNGMRMRRVATVTAGVLAMAAGAASADETFEFGTFELSLGVPVSFEITLPGDAAVTGFLFEGFFDDLGDGGQWASDMQMTIEDGSGATYAIGGFDVPMDDEWDFQGSGSDEDGFYAHDGAGSLAGMGFAGGPYTVTFVSTFGQDGHEWSDVVVTFLREDGATTVIEAFEVVHGSHVSGGLAEIEGSDDASLRTRSALGFTALEPNLMEIVFDATTDASSPTGVTVTTESRVNNPGGTGKLRLKDWNTGAFDQIDTYPVGQEDGTRSVGPADAGDYVSGGGEIEVSIKHVVVATFSAQGFDSFFDVVEVGVE